MIWGGERVNCRRLMLSKHLNFIIIEFCKHLITGTLFFSNNDTCLKYRFFICIENLYSRLEEVTSLSVSEESLFAFLTIILDTGADLQCLQ